MHAKTLCRNRREWSPGTYIRSDPHSKKRAFEITFLRNEWLGEEAGGKRVKREREKKGKKRGSRKEVQEGKKRKVIKGSSLFDYLNQRGSRSNIHNVEPLSASKKRGRCGTTLNCKDGGMVENGRKEHLQISTNPGTKGKEGDWDSVRGSVNKEQSNERGQVAGKTKRGDRLKT